MKKKPSLRLVECESNREIYESMRKYLEANDERFTRLETRIARLEKHDE